MSDTKNQHAYLATFLLDTRGYEEPIDTLIQRIRDVITGMQGTVQKVDNLGVKDFARVTNRKFPAGHYVQVNFEAPSSAPAALQEKFRLDKNFNRIMVQAL